MARDAIMNQDAKKVTAHSLDRPNSRLNRLFGASVTGMLLSALLAFLLVYLAGGQEQAVPHFLQLATAALLIGYALISAFLGWRMQRRQMAELKKALDALKKARDRAEAEAEGRLHLLAAITHELRTPMNGVIGMAGLLRTTELTPEQQNYAATIEASGRALLSIIDEILDVARPEADEEKTAPAPFAVDRLVEEVCEVMSPRAHARGIDLACYVDPELPETLIGEAGRIRQVLFNLIGNAIRFTDVGGVFVQVQAATGQKDCVQFTVRDTGIGMMPEDLDRIFAPFVQGRNAHGRGGTGLGLAICRRLVERMGGSISAKSTPGKGSTFTFELPLPAACEEEAEADKTSENALRPKPHVWLEGVHLHLLMPPLPRREALTALATAYGAKVSLIDAPLDSQGPLALPPLEEDACLIVDAAHAHVLHQALAEERADAARMWLMLRPEDRGEHEVLMHDPRLGGFLLTPLRRRTFIAQLGNAMRPLFPSRDSEDTEVKKEAAVSSEDSSGEDTPEAASFHPELAEESTQATTPASSSEETRHDNAAVCTDDHPVAYLAEDEPVNAMLARTLLERAGFAVKAFENGQALLSALETVEKNGETWPALVLMDVNMPVLDGLEATQRLRRLEVRSGRPRTPVIALTAASSDSERERCLAAGMDAFLKKPFDVQDLQDVLHDLMCNSVPQASREPVVQAEERQAVS